jgi:hypothetical protein
MLNIEIRVNGIEYFSREVDSKEKAQKLVNLFTDDCTISSDKFEIVLVNYDEDFNEIHKEDLI